MLERQEELESEDLEWAIERKYFTERYCPQGCNQPTTLPFSDEVDLKDKLQTSNGTTATIDLNPSFILKDESLQEWYSFCMLAENGLFPEAGGALDQDPEFLEMYEIYCAWKHIPKKEGTEEGS